MHNFLAKRPVGDAKKKLPAKREKERKSVLANTLTSKNTIQCQSTTNQSMNPASSNPFLNPFSVTAPKSLSVRSSVKAAPHSAAQSTLKTVAVTKKPPLLALSSRVVKKKEEPTMTSDETTAVTSLVGGGKKRTISQFFSSNQDSRHSDTKQDEKRIERKKENLCTQAAAYASSKVHQPSCESLSDDRKSSSALSLCSIPSVAFKSAADVVGRDTVNDNSCSSESENCFTVEDPGMQDIMEEDSQDGIKDDDAQEQDVSEEVQEKKSHHVVVPDIIPNLLSKCDEGSADRRATDSLRLSGVIRNKISPFTQSAKDYSHGARYSLGLTPSRLASLVSSRMHAVAAPSERVELLNTSREARYGMAPTRKGGVTCVKFDREGVLCAVGGSNGVLRVYDFDEVTFALQLVTNLDLKNLAPEIREREELPSAHVHPMVHFPGPSRDISDVCWLPSLPQTGLDEVAEEGDEDEVAVAFTFYPSIHIYDLNTLDRTHNLTPLQEDRSSGNCCMVCLAQAAASPKQQSFRVVLAGGNTGIFRRWNVTAASSDDTKPMWEVLADPLSKAGWC